MGHLLPLVKVSLLTLSVAGAATLGHPFPIPNVDQWNQFQYLEYLVSEEVEHETLLYIEQWFHDTKKKDGRSLDGKRVARVAKLMSSWNETLCQKASNAENWPKWWYPSMTAEVFSGNEGKKRDEMGQVVDVLWSLWRTSKN